MKDLGLFDSSEKITIKCAILCTMGYEEQMLATLKAKHVPITVFKNRDKAGNGENLIEEYPNININYVHQTN